MPDERFGVTRENEHRIIARTTGRMRYQRIRFMVRVRVSWPNNALRYDQKVGRLSRTALVARPAPRANAASGADHPIITDGREPSGKIIPNDDYHYRREQSPLGLGHPQRARCAPGRRDRRGLSRPAVLYRTAAPGRRHGRLIAHRPLAHGELSGFRARLRPGASILRSFASAGIDELILGAGDTSRPSSRRRLPFHERPDARPGSHLRDRTPFLERKR